jgi:hypothetical protein
VYSVGALTGLLGSTTILDLVSDPMSLLSCLCHSEDLLQPRREGDCVLAIWDSLPLH